jgi:adenylate cyclase
VPAEKRIDFRIGINVGDIVVEDGDIFGDGVNVAARLEALAKKTSSANSNSPSKTWASRRLKTSRAQ